MNSLIESSLNRRSRKRHRHGGLALPALPTDALPGSPEKVAVLALRASLKVALWHPSDARWQRSLH